jgi:ribosomal protein S18 acetylase RimI-like enzyme
MNAVFQLLSEDDIKLLLGMMREFYSQQEMRFDEGIATAAARKLMENPKLGQIYLIFRGSDLAGYFALTYCFSLEFHGRFALLDELYIREPFRRQKLGRAVAEFAENVCRESRIKALRLEVGKMNTVAQALYQASGFARDERFLYTKWL